MDTDPMFFNNKKNYEHFRWGNAGDTPAIRKLILTGHPSEHFLADQVGMMLNPGLVRVLLHQWDDRHPEMVAFSASMLMPDEDEYRLVTIVVREDMQRRGLGTQMMDDVIFHAGEKAKRRFITTMVPEFKVYEDDKEFMLPWYSKMGFAASGVVERDIYPREDRLYDGYLFERPI